MGKYLDDPVLNEALENYFDPSPEVITEGILQALFDRFRQGKVTDVREVDGILSDIVTKGGKKYVIKVPDEIREQGSEALKIARTEFKDFLPRYKAIGKELKKNGYNDKTAGFSLDNFKFEVFRDSYYNVEGFAGYQVGLEIKMDQMIYNKQTSAGSYRNLANEMCKYLADKLRKNNKIDFSWVWNGSKTFFVGIFFRICKTNAVELKEIKDY